MSTRRFTTTALAVVLSLTFAAAPVMANRVTGMAVVTGTVADKVMAAVTAIPVVMATEIPYPR